MSMSLHLLIEQTCQEMREGVLQHFGMDCLSDPIRLGWGMAFGILESGQGMPRRPLDCSSQGHLSHLKPCTVELVEPSQLYLSAFHGRDLLLEGCYNMFSRGRFLQVIFHILKCIAAKLSSCNSPPTLLDPPGASMRVRNSSQSSPRLCSMMRCTV